MVFGERGGYGASPNRNKPPARKILDKMNIIYIMLVKVPPHSDHFVYSVKTPPAPKLRQKGVFVFAPFSKGFRLPLSLASVVVGGICGHGLYGFSQIYHHAKVPHDQFSLNRHHDCLRRWPAHT